LSRRWRGGSESEVVVTTSFGELNVKSS